MQLCSPGGVTPTCTSAFTPHPLTQLPGTVTFPPEPAAAPVGPPSPTRFVNPTEYVKAHREPPTEGGGAAAIGRVLGDVDGDGRDDFILRRGTTFFINTDAVVPGGDRETDAEFQWGRADDQAFLGDVDGDGR